MRRSPKRVPRPTRPPTRTDAETTRQSGVISAPRAPHASARVKPKTGDWKGPIGPLERRLHKHPSSSILIAAPQMAAGQAFPVPAITLPEHMLEASGRPPLIYALPSIILLIAEAS
jgi:hypothetical protein